MPPLTHTAPMRCSALVVSRGGGTVVSLGTPAGRPQRARAVRVHVCIISHLKSQMPSITGKEKKQKQLIAELGNVFRAVMKQHNLPAGDFPDLEVRAAANEPTVNDERRTNDTTTTARTRPNLRPRHIYTRARTGERARWR